MVKGMTTRSPTLSDFLAAGPHLHDFAHGLTAHDIAGFHAGHEMIVEMQVRAADGATRDLDDGVPLVLDPGIGYAIAADVRGAVPNQCLHRDLRCLNVSVFRLFNISRTRSFQDIFGSRHQGARPPGGHATRVY